MSKSRSIAGVGVWLLALLGLSSAASATAIYSYTGTPYSPSYTSSPYTTAMSITGSFTLSAAVAANQTDIDILGSLGNFSVSDGVNLYDQTSSTVFSEFRVSTDSLGNIFEWALELQFLNGNELRSCNAGAIVATGVCTGLVQDNVYDAPYNGGASNLSTPGTFTLVPEPTSALLLGMGLLGLASRRHTTMRPPTRG